MSELTDMFRCLRLGMDLTFEMCIRRLARREYRGCTRTCKQGEGNRQAWPDFRPKPRPKPSEGGGES